MFGSKKGSDKPAGQPKPKKEKVKVDYKNNQFTTKFQNRRYTAPNFTDLLIQVKFKVGYAGYTTTYEASKALRNKEHQKKGD